jgi:hypothetical protein
VKTLYRYRAFSVLPFDNPFSIAIEYRRSASASLFAFSKFTPSLKAAGAYGWARRIQGNIKRLSRVRIFFMTTDSFVMPG